MSVRVNEMDVEKEEVESFTECLCVSAFQLAIAGECCEANAEVAATPSVSARKASARSPLTHTKASASLQSALADSPSRSSTLDGLHFFSPSPNYKRRKEGKKREAPTKREQLRLRRCLRVPKAICISLSH